MFYITNYLYLNRKEQKNISEFKKTGTKKRINMMIDFSRRNVRRSLYNLKFDYIINYNGYGPIPAML